MNKQSNKEFTELIDYIERNLTEKISYKKLAQILGVNEYTMHRIFLFVTGLTLGDYIRKRRLSQAAIDLINENQRVIDIAIKYGYESSQSFARAFKSEIGINPTEVNKKTKIKFFSKYEVEKDENINEFTYSLEKNVKFNLYGISLNTTINECHNIAPQFWNENSDRLTDKVKYGLLEYNKNCDNENAIYYIAQKNEFKKSQLINLKSSDYLVFDYVFIDSNELNNFIKKIYKTIILNFRYELTEMPDIEEYSENNKMKIYIPIC